MIVRVLTTADLPAIEAVVLSNKGYKKWLGLERESPLTLEFAVPLIRRLIALDYWRFFGAFDDAGTLLSVQSFYFWCKIENRKKIPVPPNFYGPFSLYTLKGVNLTRSIDPGGFSDAYIETDDFATKYFVDRGYTSRWIRIPAGDWRLPHFVAHSGYGLHCTVVYKVTAGERYPDGYDETNQPPNWRWAGGPFLSEPIDSLIIRLDDKGIKWFAP